MDTPIEKILKFKFEDNNFILEKGEMVNISDDKRSTLMPKKLFVDKKYRIKHGVYMCKSDFCMSLARKNHSHPNISAIYCPYEGKHILIVPKNSYSFINDSSVEPTDFNVIAGLPTMFELQKNVEKISK